MLRLLGDLVSYWRIYERSRRNVRPLRSVVRESDLRSFCYFSGGATGRTARCPKLHRAIGNYCKDLAGRLGTSREAARSLVRRLRLSRQMAKDGTVRVNIDLSDIQYRPAVRRSSHGDGADVDALQAEIEQLRAELTKLETQKSSIEVIAAGHRADFERERERSDKLMAKLRLCRHA